MDDYIVDTLMRDLCGHDRQPSAFLVYIFLYRQASGGEVQIALRDIAESTGLSKRSVQNALTRLIRRRLVSARRDHITAVAVYTILRPWKR